MKPRAADWLPIIGLVIIIVVFDGQLLGSRIPRGEDHWLAFIPAYSVGEGCWPPRWNPFVCGGAPYAANPQYSPWYPPRWVFGLTTAPAAYGPYCFGHFLVAALAMLVCLRSLGCAATGATIGAVSFACGSYIQGHLSNPGLLFSSVWLPLVVALAFQATGREGLTWPTWLGLLMAGVVFAGSPHNMFYAALIVGLITVWRMVGTGILLAKNHGRAGRTLARIAGHLGLAVAVALGVSAVQWIPTAEFVRLSQRHILSVNELARDPLAWGWLGSLFVGSRSPWATEYLDKSTYFGMSVLPLLLLAVVTPRRERPDGTPLLPGREWFFVVLALIGVWIALGTQAGAFQLLAHVPVACRLSGPSRALVLFAIGTSALVGLGADRFLREEEWGKRWSFRFVLFATAALAAILFLAKCRHLSWQDIADIALSAATPRDTSLFLAVNGAVFLALGTLLVAAAAFLPPRFSSKRWFGLAVALVLCLDLFHFRLRLPLPMSPREDLDRAATVSFVNGDRARPFRVVGYEATRVNQGDMNDQSLRQFLMPNLAALYRLQDVQGFDPLMLRDYVRLVEATAGRSPVDDPARMLNLARPDPTLFRLLNVRYVIGDVRERQIAYWPSVQSGICTVRLDEPTTLAGVSLVSLLHGAEDFAEGTTVAVVTALSDAPTTGRTPVLPTGAHAAIRAGVETADWRAADARFPCRHRAVRENMAWMVTAPFGPVRVANYYAQVSFVQPVVARAIEIRQTAPGILLSVATVATVLPESAGWEKVFERDRYRIYRNRDVLGGAWLVHRVRAVANEDEALGLLAKGKVDVAGEALVAGKAARDILAPSSDAAGTSADHVEFIRYEPDRIEVRTESSRPALLCFAEIFYPGWTAQLDGHPTELIRVNFLLRGVAVPTPGNHTVMLRFAPRSLTIGMGISAIAFIAALGLLLAASKSFVFGFKRV